MILPVSYANWKLLLNDSSTGASGNSQAAVKVGVFSCHSQMYTSVTEVSYQKQHNRTRVYENENSNQMSNSLLIT